jgi:hypothetical protein
VTQGGKPAAPARWDALARAALRQEAQEDTALRREFVTFHLEGEREAGRATRIVVLHGEDGSMTGLLVDSVRDVLRIPEDRIRPSTGGENDAVAALLVRGDEFVSLLDLDRVLDLAG